MVAVRQVPISACGARKLLLKRLQMDIYVRHFGDVVVWSVPEPVEGPTASHHSGLDPESPEPPVAKTASCASHRNICPIAEVGYVASGSAQCRFCNLDFGRIGVLIFASTSRQPLEGSRLRPRRRGEIPCQPRRQLGGRLERSRFKKKKAGHLDYIRCSEEVNQIMDRITKSTNSSDMVQGI